MTRLSGVFEDVLHWYYALDEKEEGALVRVGLPVNSTFFTLLHHPELQHSIEPLQYNNNR